MIATASLSLCEGVGAYDPPFSSGAILGNILDFNPATERYFFNSADQMVGVRGIFSEASPPLAVFLNGAPFTYRICGAYSFSLLPLWHQERHGAPVRSSPDLEKGTGASGVLELDTSWRALKGRHMTVTVGDETGDAMMLDFLDDAEPVGNRGSLLGLELGMGGGRRYLDRWWVGARYVIDDWLAYRRHPIRVSIAPVENGRENVGTVEKAMFGGSYLLSSSSWTTQVDAGAQMFPALWIRDPGTRRTAKWRAASGYAAINARRSFRRSSVHSLSLMFIAQDLRAESTHRDQERDVKSVDRSETARLTLEEWPHQQVVLHQGISVALEHFSVESQGSLPTYGYDGPSHRLNAGAYVAAEYCPSRVRSLEIEMRADKRESVRAIYSLGCIGHAVSRGMTALQLRAQLSGRYGGPFQESGWSRVLDVDPEEGELRFEGRFVEPENFQLVEARLWSQFSRWISVSATVFHERVTDFVVPVVSRWVSLGGGLERVRSGYWANGGCVTSTGLEFETSGHLGPGRINTFMFVRDVVWEGDLPGVSAPPLGGRIGGGVQVAVRLPKRTEFTTRLRTAAAPRFASYGSWTEEVGTERMRWDASLWTQLSRTWEVRITALDILDNGHIEIPGGNAVGFRVVGQLRYNWSKRRNGETAKRRETETMAMIGSMDSVSTSSFDTR